MNRIEKDDEVNGILVFWGRCIRTETGCMDILVLFNGFKKIVYSACLIISVHSVSFFMEGWKCKGRG